MMKIGSAMIGALALVLLTGCATPLASHPPSQHRATSALPARNYFTYSDLSKWGQPGSWVVDIDLAGQTIYEALLTGSGEDEQVVPSNGTAVLHGRTLEIQANWWNAAPLPAGNYAVTKNGTYFDVAVPWSDGTVKTFPFKQDTVSHYNSFVSQLQTSAHQAVIAAEQAAAQRQAAQQAAEQQQQQEQQQQDQAQAAQLQAKATQACSAVGGEIQGDITVTNGVVGMGAYCAANPNRTWRSSGGPVSCDGYTVPFQDDGTLDQTDLQSIEQNSPGCFG